MESENSRPPEAETTRSWTRGALWQLTAGWRATYLAAIGALAVSIVLSYGVPLLSQVLVDGLLEGEWPRGFARLAARSGLERPELFLGVLGIIALTAGAGGFQYLRGRWSARASEGIVRRLRDRLYGHIARLPQAYHDRSDTGDLVQRCTSDVETVRVFLGAQVVEIARASLMLLFVLPVLFWMDRALALYAVVLFPVVLVFALVFFRRVQRRFLEMDEAEGRLTSVLQENLAGIRVVRAFGQQAHEEARFAERNQDLRDQNRSLIDLLGSYWATSDFLCLMQLGIVLFVGGHRLANDLLSVGTLFAFLSYHGMVIFPLRQLGRTLTDTGKAVVALGRLEEILDVAEEDGYERPVGDVVDAARAAELEPAGRRRSRSGEAAEREVAKSETTRDGRSADLLRAPRGTLRFERLTFEYGDGTRALTDFDVEIAAGETVAILGPPGAGKTTLVNLLARLYDYEQGSIRVDGVELSAIPRRRMRRRLGVVSQEPFLYSKTIAANLRVGRHDAALAELEAHADMACVHTDISHFSAGYDTKVGERGVTLSGGQRQRLSLARALLREPDVLVLDDALSAVDTLTEARVLEVLGQRRGRSTTLLITSRLSSLAAADRVLVLEDGRIVQLGRHADLLREDGPYRRLWAIQGALESELERDLARVEPDAGATLPSPPPKRRTGSAQSPPSRAPRAERGDHE